MLDGVSHDTPSSKNEGRAPTNLFYDKSSNLENLFFKLNLKSHGIFISSGEILPVFNEKFVEIHLNCCLSNFIIFNGNSPSQLQIKSISNIDNIKKLS